MVCNPVYTAFHTRPTKERLSVLDVLRNGRERIYRLNGEALGILESQLTWSKAGWKILEDWSSQQDLDEVAFMTRLDEKLPWLGQQQRKLLMDAAAIAAYHAETDYPVVHALICDDAPQFNWLARRIMLCWVHEGRPYKKLLPVVPLHRKLLDDFLKHFWAYYHQLLMYHQKPTPEDRLRQDAEFDSLFSLQTGYAVLDKRIAKTLSKKRACCWY